MVMAVNCNFDDGFGRIMIPGIDERTCDGQRCW